VKLETMGRPDRVDRTENGSRCILDFKTGRRPEKSVDTKAILTGRDLQLVVYGMMFQRAFGDAPEKLEIRPIHPTALRESGPRLVAPIDYFAGTYRDAVGETLAVLGELLLRGALVPNPEPRRCSYCEFNIACRRLHPPSAERVRDSGMAEVQRYFALADKSKTRPLLGDGATR
jgi:RecB family exonuclease